MKKCFLARVIETLVFTFVRKLKILLVDEINTFCIWNNRCIRIIRMVFELIDYSQRII